MAPRTRTTSAADDAGSIDPIARIDGDLDTLRGDVFRLGLQVGNLAIDVDRHADILEDGLVGDLEPVPPPTEAQARDPFAGPVVPLLYGALAIAGVAGAVLDGVGMVGRTIRRL
jgi:hypothetical protein